MKLLQIFMVLSLTTIDVFSMSKSSRFTISKATQPATKINALLEKLQTLFAEYKQDNPIITPAQQALYHFQNTQAPSGSYVPIIPVQEHSTDISAYNMLICSIKLNQPWYELAPSVQYGVLLHEYRHRLQHIAGIFDKEQNELSNQLFYPAAVIKKAKSKKTSFNFHTYSQTSWKPYEYDADLFAATHISCPTCLKITQCAQKTDNSSLGYFSKNDTQLFIDQAMFNPTCPAHSLTTGDFEHNKIVKDLYKKLEYYKFFPSELLYDEIMNLDKASGSLLQHIPTYAIDLLESIKQYDDFAQLLIDKTIKEVDLAQQIKQAEQDVAAGKFKLITAGDEPIISDL